MLVAGIIFVVAFMVFMIVRWIVKTIGLGKSIHDSAKYRKVQKTEDEQWKHLTSGN